ncbi:type II secretion system F family protein [Carboxydothermus hydrogenoformans]|uniref:Type IV pilus assembly protein PilC n=1 Tax=Carboxydothermus hydrogenoformans (strain ATCC BAA-161 / DSM 6008 / Z-2901) TaxID=246194 RepID=Q3AEE6_CARHZ|nr:type II secretion system F family protein [Carboxydothermus hydrogenoformans]ABB14936.1 type IV pilus assembly protein PilC [Carboxydothermus hydrogenoformans Z-2901]
MPQYRYKAKDLSGRVVSGLVEAESEVGARNLLREKRFFVLELKKSDGAVNSGFSFSFQRKLKAKDLALMAKQLGTMIAAGVPLLTAVNVLSRQVENKTLKKSLIRIEEKLRNGNTLSESLREEKIFPELMCSMVEVGEVGGVLDNVLDRLSLHYEKEAQLSEKIRSAMTYPMVVLFAAIAAVLVLVTYVLPQFTGILLQANIELPLITQVVIKITNFFSQHAATIFLTLGAIIGGLLYWFSTPPGRKIRDQLSLNMPLIGTLVLKGIIARFSRTMATLVQGGVPMLQSLRVVQKTLGNGEMQKVLELAEDKVREGESLATFLAQSRWFPPLLTQMMLVGEETGQLDAMLTKAADFYEAEVDAAVGRLSSIIEPVLILFMGGIVGLIIVSIMLPMFNMVNAVK